MPAGDAIKLPPLAPKGDAALFVVPSPDPPNEPEETLPPNWPVDAPAPKGDADTEPPKPLVELADPPKFADDPPNDAVALGGAPKDPVDDGAAP